ncbi:MAG: 50S ribosomal protein L9 [Rhodospirillales bacterium]|jgi:large subunit ribosomal protein L9|nr:50S ribosomal protein L9 [Rhodospirillales bacterium]
MDIILLERVEKLGQMGDIVRVRPGYARNYLFPQKKAVRATDDNKKRFEQQRTQLEASNLERRSEAEAVAKKMDGLTVTLIRQAGESGQLYGSVSARDIADAATAAGFTIGRGQVRLNQPIKALGVHAVGVSLHPEVALAIRVNVARTADEAEAQLKGGQPAAEGRAAKPSEEELDTLLQAQLGEEEGEDGTGGERG